MTNEEFKKTFSAKRYIGDAVFLHFDGYHFVLTTNRFGIENWVALEPEVFEELIQFRKQVYKAAKEIERGGE